jgi:replication factor C subunit 2/4
MLVLYEVVIFCRIIEPLASRCAKFRFKPLTEEIMSNRILYICNEEGIHLDAEVVVLVVVLFVMVLILCL